ncbi:MAG TPA: VTT domain-containing protein [Phycisphaerales bacterium]|nr:VTT domain-containing protein [Phycisphaerales bacterium]
MEDVKTENTPGTPAPQSWWDYAVRLGPASLLAVGATFLPIAGSVLLLANINIVGEWLRSHGSQGVAMYIAGFAFFAGVALLPTYSSAILGGWAFGFAVGLPAALAGFLGGSLIGYAVARPASAERVNRLIDEKPQWKAVRDALMGGSKGKTLLIVTLLRLPPNSPFALTNLVLASVRTPLWIYVVGTLIGMTPRTALVLYIASQVQGKMADEAAKGKPWWWIAAGIGATVVVLGIIGLIAKKALAKVTATSPAPATQPPAH